MIINAKFVFNLVLAATINTVMNTGLISKFRVIKYTFKGVLTDVAGSPIVITT